MAETEISESNCYVALSNSFLDVKSVMDRVRSSKAGAIVLFAGKCACKVINRGLIDEI